MYTFTCVTELVHRMGGKTMEAQIGEAAGKVWQALHTGGPMGKEQIRKATRLSSDLLNHAIGWLARESKLTFEKGKNGVILGLRE